MRKKARCKYFAFFSISHSFSIFAKQDEVMEMREAFDLKGQIRVEVAEGRGLDR